MLNTHEINFLLCIAKSRYLTLHSLAVLIRGCNPFRSSMLKVLFTCIFHSGTVNDAFYSITIKKYFLLHCSYPIIELIALVFTFALE